MGRKTGRLDGGPGWALHRAGAAAKDAKAAGASRDGRPTFRLRIEKRAGRSVTVLAASLVGDEALAALLRDLRTALATGGTRKGEEIELQGDHRDRLRDLLRGRGYVVKG